MCLPCVKHWTRYFYPHLIDSNTKKKEIKEKKCNFIETKLWSLTSWPTLALDVFQFFGCSVLRTAISRSCFIPNSFCTISPLTLYALAPQPSSLNLKYTINLPVSELSHHLFQNTTSLFPSCVLLILQNLHGLYMQS